MGKTIKTKSFELAVYINGNSDAKRLAIVIPGRVDSKDYINNISHVDYLASRGFLAISFDPPGVWESPGDITIYTTTNYIKAISELIHHFGDKPTLLIGHSRGGTVAMLEGIDDPNVIGLIAIMSYYGAPSAPDAESKKRGWVDEFRDLPPGDIKSKKKKHFKLPMSYFKDGESYEALEELKRCKKPKLFFYGSLDIMNDSEDIKKMYDESSGPKEIYEVKSEHDYRLHREVIKEINIVIGTFLDKYF